MWKFILKFILSALVVLGIFTFYSLYRLECMYGNPYASTLDLNGSETQKSIYKSRQRIRVKKLLLGDSVAEQIYPASENNGGELYSLSCNQAISMAGHYCLLRSFLETNKDALPEEVVLYYNTFSLGNNLDKFAFHYFLKSIYYNNDFNSWLQDEVLTNRIKQIPFHYLAKNAIVKSINYSPRYTLDDENEGYIASPISLHYLRKMQSLCKQNGISFTFLPSPVKRSRKEDIESLRPNDDAMLKEYASKIEYLDDSLFMDDVHFKHCHIPADPLCIYAQQKQLD